MLLLYSDDLQWHIVWLHSFNHMPAEDVTELMCQYQLGLQILSMVLSNKGCQTICQVKWSTLRAVWMWEIIATRPGISKPSIYLWELQELYSRALNWIDASTICRTMHRIGVTHQVIRHIELQWCEHKRAEYWYDISIFNTLMFLWIDETGCD